MVKEKKESKKVEDTPSTFKPESRLEEEDAAKPITVTHQRMIATALNNVMQDVTYVQKDGKVAFGGTKYNYASEAGFLEKARPAMVKHGLVLMPSCEEIQLEKGESFTNKFDKPERSPDMVFVKMSYTLTHTSGAVWHEKLSMWGSGSDKGDKAIYKAITGANKYMLFKLLQMPTGDDPESGVQPEEEKPPAKLTDKQYVLNDILHQFPGDNDAGRTSRLSALNMEVIGVNGNPVRTPDEITDQQWAEIATKIKGQKK